MKKSSRGTNHRTLPNWTTPKNNKKSRGKESKSERLQHCSNNENENTTEVNETLEPTESDHLATSLAKRKNNVVEFFIGDPTPTRPHGDETAVKQDGEADSP